MAIFKLIMFLYKKGYKRFFMTNIFFKIFECTSKYENKYNNHKYKKNNNDTSIYKQSEKKLRSTSENKNYDLNGQIDPSQQGDAGDCWLLSGLNSFSYSKKGREIIDDAITIKENGASVNFRGLKKQVEITNDEMNAARKSGLYSDGDDDVLLMELATEKVMDMIQDGDISSPLFLQESASDSNLSIRSGNFRDIVYLLTGDKAEYTQNTSKKENNNGYERRLNELRPTIKQENKLDSIYNTFEKDSDSISATISFSDETNFNSNNPVKIKDIERNDVILTNGTECHSWSIKSVDGDNVTIVNPWDSSFDVTVSRNELSKYADGIEYYKYN